MERPNIHPNAIFTVRRTAEMLGVSIRTLNRWVETGLIRKRYTVELKPMFTGRDILKRWDERYRLLEL